MLKEKKLAYQSLLFMLNTLQKDFEDYAGTMQPDRLKEYCEAAELLARAIGSLDGGRE